jgi:Rod binding domain-containing protein
MELGIAQVASPEAAGASARPSKETADHERASRACKEFESILIYHMLSTMRRAFESEEESESGFGGDIFKSMMDEQLSIALAKAGGIGLSDLLERSLGLGTGEIRPGDSPVEYIYRSAAARVKPAEPGETQAQPVLEPEAEPSRATTTAGSAGTDRGPGQSQETASSRIGAIVERLRPYERTIKAAARVFGVDANLIRAVILQESSGNLRAVSHKGAKGLMQLTDATARDLGVTNPFDPAQNIFGGARLLARLLGTFGGNLKLALASYNAGLGAVRKYGGIPPYKETQDYVKRVTDYLASLQGQAGAEG